MKDFDLEAELKGFTPRHTQTYWGTKSGVLFPLPWCHWSERHGARAASRHRRRRTGRTG